ncbi:MAG: NAD-dependent epimerase/dehydratase family protein [Ktedonobacteraceae bacterium]|nr:NAD-dependent epimerase/dehydratase family protein [Ktedonobacteraceae bacterium]
MSEHAWLRTAFVTGGSGFIGHHLIAYLEKRGVEVRALARSIPAAFRVEQAGAEAIKGDLDDKEVLQAAMTGCDAVFHLAARGVGWGRYEDFYRVNVEGTRHVLTAAQTAGVPCLVYVSSEAVLVNGGPLINADETWPRAKEPAGFYGKTKGQAEELVERGSTATLRTVIVRPRFVWGKGAPGLAQLVQTARTGSFAWIDGGHYLTSTCHVTNVCEGLVLAAERGRAGEIYFVTDGAPVEFRAFISALLHALHVEPGERSLPGWLVRGLARAGEVAWGTLHLKGAPPFTLEAVRLIGQEVTVNDAKARHELGYRATVSREEGLSLLAAGKTGRLE